ncbi:MAG TPA: hypothetical protein VLA11_08955 [Woeseiaceae bacterium]|jgi:peptidoglycan/LPS O-acetylase OafA/YrhL|nr:hypothetical protein [Woeseiaceae bacterium]
MNWDALDYAVFGAMIAAVAVGYSLALQKSRNKFYRYAVGLALAAAFLLVWVNGAVGIIGDESNDLNMLYLGVIAVGVIGALLARFEATGMARAMLATAVAQALIAVLAITGESGSSGPGWLQDILVLTIFFVGLWLVSARLFKKAASSELRG